MSRKFQLDLIRTLSPVNNSLALSGEKRQGRPGQVTTANSRHYIYLDDGLAGTFITSQPAHNTANLYFSQRVNYGI